MLCAERAVGEEPFVVFLADRKSIFEFKFSNSNVRPLRIETTNLFNALQNLLNIMPHHDM